MFTSKIRNLLTNYKTIRIMIMPEELTCKDCIWLDFFEIRCALRYELSKDEFAQTVPMYSVITGKKCRHKNKQLIE